MPVLGRGHKLRALRKGLPDGGFRLPCEAPPDCFRSGIPPHFLERRFLVKHGLLALALCLGLGSAACQSAQKTMPHIGMGSLNMDAELTRADLVVLDTVEGRSSTQRILFGAITIIDGSKLRLFGISFFTDKYTYFQEPGFLGMLFGGPDAEDRAYYKALEQQPDADIVLVKSMDRERGGIPLIFSTSEVTFRGKAMKIKADK